MYTFYNNNRSNEIRKIDYIIVTFGTTNKGLCYQEFEITHSLSSTPEHFISTRDEGLKGKVLQTLVRVLKRKNCLRIHY